MIFQLRVLISIAALFCANVVHSDTSIVIGVRVDAPPFSFHVTRDSELLAENLRGHLYEKGYRGYLVALCDRALNEMLATTPGLAVDVLPVNARTRLSSLIAGEIDVLCDPTTLTPDRLKVAYPTVPVYLTGITYASSLKVLENASNYCGPLVGAVGSTTGARGGIETILNEGHWSVYSDVLREAIGRSDGSTLGRTVYCKGAKEPQSIIRIYDSHAQAAEALCSGGLQYYVGDLEIVRAALSRIDGCKYEDAKETFTDDRYVILVGKNGPSGQGNAVGLRFMGSFNAGVLSSPSTIDSAFRSYLSESAPTEKLQALFWAIRGY